MLEAAGWMCVRCLDDKSQLHVHHRRYVRGRKLWEYSDNELLVLCDACHAREHGLMEALHELMRDGMVTLQDVVALVAGYRGGCQQAGADSCYTGPPDALEDLPMSFAAGELAGAVSLLSTATIRAMAQEAAALGKQQLRETIDRIARCKELEAMNYGPSGRPAS
jgi:hypothetical protein